jgi:hypothetical protein
MYVCGKSELWLGRKGVMRWMLCFVKVGMDESKVR